MQCGADPLRLGAGLRWYNHHQLSAHKKKWGNSEAPLDLISRKYLTYRRNLNHPILNFIQFVSE